MGRLLVLCAALGFGGGAEKEAVGPLLARLEACVAAGRLREAARLGRRLEAVLPAAGGREAARLRVGLARLYRALGEPARARSVLRPALAGAGWAQPEVVFLYADLSRETARLAEACWLLDRWLSVPRGPAARLGAALRRVRLALAAGLPGAALERCREIRVRCGRVPPEVAYELLCLEGEALLAAGRLKAAEERFWRALTACGPLGAQDPRAALALERLCIRRGRLRALEEALRRAVRRGEEGGAALLLEFLELRELVRAGSFAAVLAEMEEASPPLWAGSEGGDWPLFEAARRMVARDRRRARDAALQVLERGETGLAVYVLSLVGDQVAVQALYRRALHTASDHELRNLTLALARSGHPQAEWLLHRLQRDPSAVAPAALRAAAREALAVLSPPRPAAARVE